ncbi:MAG: transposase, partial [Prolixibacteraceae bacterium]
STMNGWFERVCRLLEILYDHLCRRIVQSNYIQADETGMPVQTREKEGSTHKGFLCDFYSPPLGLLCFIYDKGRGSEVPKNFLKGFSGAMQTDGYTGYTRFLQENADHIKPLACLAHVTMTGPWTMIRTGAIMPLRK